MEKEKPTGHKMISFNILKEKISHNPPPPPSRRAIYFTQPYLVLRIIWKYHYLWNTLLFDIHYQDFHVCTMTMNIIYLNHVPLICLLFLNRTVSTLYKVIMFMSS